MRTTSVLALTGALLALAAAPATAESWHGRDAKRDVRAYDIKRHLDLRERHSEGDVAARPAT